MATLTAPRSTTTHRPPTVALLISAAVGAVLVLSIALTLPRLTFAPAAPRPVGGITWAPGGGGNESHARPSRTSAVGSQGRQNDPAEPRPLHAHR